MAAIKRLEAGDALRLQMAVSTEWTEAETHGYPLLAWAKGELARLGATPEEVREVLAQLYPDSAEFLKRKAVREDVETPEASSETA